MNACIKVEPGLLHGKVGQGLPGVQGGVPHLQLVRQLSLEGRATWTLGKSLRDRENGHSFGIEWDYEQKKVCGLQLVFETGKMVQVGI